MNEFMEKSDDSQRLARTSSSSMRPPETRESDDADARGRRDARSETRASSTTREETMKTKTMRFALTENLRRIDALDDALDDEGARETRETTPSSMVSTLSAYFEGKENDGTMPIATDSFAPTPTPRKSTLTPTRRWTARGGGEGGSERRRRTRLALTVIEQWRWFATSARVRAHAEARATTRALAAWRRLAEARRHRALRATIYARLGRRQRAFTAWREEVGEAREERMERARRARARARARKSERAAWYHDYARSTRAAFETWREQCAPEVRAERARMVFYDRYARKTTVKRALDAWRAGSRAQMEARADALVAESFYEAKTCGRAFRTWRSATRRQRDRGRHREWDSDVDDRVARFQSYRAVNATARAFATWADAARASRTRAVESTPVKVRAERTQRALYAWLFDRSKASDYEEEVLDFLDEREALREDVELDAELDAELDELDELEAAVDEYEALREETKALVEEVKRSKTIADARKRSARRRVLRYTAEHLRKRRDALLPLVRRAAGEARWRSRSTGTSSSFGFSAFDEETDEEEDESDEDDPLLYRKFV